MENSGPAPSMGAAPCQKMCVVSPSLSWQAVNRILSACSRFLEAFQLNSCGRDHLPDSP